MGTFSIWHWLVVLVIVILVFGTKKLRNLGGDLGSAIKGFKEGMKDANADNNTSAEPSNNSNLTFDDEIKHSAATSNAFKEGVKSQDSTAATQNETITVEATPVKEDVQKRDGEAAATETAGKDNASTKT